jgi:hypothetical protein
VLLKAAFLLKTMKYLRCSVEINQKRQEPMTIQTLSAGGIIEARCTRCREVLNHRIVAMVDGKVVRVECNTCNGTHNYHAPPTVKEAKIRTVSKSGSRPGTAAPRASKRDPVEIEREEWALQQPTFDQDKALPYEMTGKYQIKRLILHPTFGLGVVKAVIIPSKMQVLFKDGVKLLRCQ